MGMIVLGCSIWAFYDGKTFARLIEEGAAEFDKPITLEIYRTSSVLLMIASVIIILIAFFGCCGAIKVRKFREIVKKISFTTQYNVKYFSYIYRKIVSCCFGTTFSYF